MKKIWDTFSAEQIVWVNLSIHERTSSVLMAHEVCEVERQDERLGRWAVDRYQELIHCAVSLGR